MRTHEDVPILTPDYTAEMMDSPQERTQLDQWIKNLSDFAWIFDRRFNLVQVDTRVSSRSSQRPEDILGRSVWETFPELADTLWGQELRKAAEDLSGRRFEFFHPTWRLWLDCHIFHSGDCITLLAIDSTPRKKNEAALQEARQDLEAFSYSITHDMRAPLRAMQSFARILQQECSHSLGPEGGDYLRRIVVASERLDRLIQDALAYSQLSRAALSLGPVDLAELLSEIVESYPQFQAPLAALSIAHPLPTVMGNTAALTQCLANLLDNSIKFSKSGDLPRVEIWAEPRGARTRIHIKDHGIGIDPVFHRKIFNMFYQHDPSYPGTGIGLVVVRKAAEKMNGSVGLESELGKGSVFYLELNLAE